MIKCYPYESISNNAIQIIFPKEYFFPAFINTTNKLRASEEYRKISKIFLDLRNCEQLHGIGMSLEIQQFHEICMTDQVSVYCIGGREIYSIVKYMVEDSQYLIPYYDTIDEILL